jgi:putative membrane protein
MFRAFLTDWLEAKNSELESYLNELGVENQLDVATFAFRRKLDQQTKAVVLVSNYHPGPFLNIGSSVLPFLFHATMEKRFGAVGIVPHGVSGHELNLVSQDENSKVLEWAVNNVGAASYVGEATKVERSSNDLATATCQVFDGSALVTMTASPHDMEDIPSDVASHLKDSTKNQFRHIALIDAHNCLSDQGTLLPQNVDALEQAASRSLKSLEKMTTAPFRIGICRISPPEFGLRDGLGLGGIVVVAVEVGEQRFAYITIDGNNMIKGLREEILSTAKEAGFEDGEVMTTDTHMVNGVVSAPLGYFRVGEAVPTSILLGYIATACRNAIADLEPCEVGVASGQVAVTTLGSKSLREVMGLVYRNSKLTAATLFPMVILVTALTLIFLV